MKTAVITGVSSGIGLGTARVLVEGGWRVFGSVRSSEDGEAVREQLGDCFEPLVFDVRDVAAVQRGAEQVESALAGRILDGLVNNAGIAKIGPLLLQPLEEIELQLDVNVLGPLITTRAFAPLLGTDRQREGDPGRIVNVSSVGGQIAAPFIGGYSASKHALEGLSDSLRRELEVYGIDVIVVGPGSVATPIWQKGRDETDADRYTGTDYEESLLRFRDYANETERRGMPPEKIGKVIFEALTARRPAPRYAPVAGRLTNWTLPRILPRRTIDRAIESQLGLTRRK